MPSEPTKVKQKASGFCLAACICSLNNTWGGDLDQSNKTYFNQTSGAVIKWEGTGVARVDAEKNSLQGVKDILDGGNYAYVYMTGKYSHYVLAYSATGATAEEIMVMDPYTGTCITLKKAFETQSASFNLTKKMIPGA